MKNRQNIINNLSKHLFWDVDKTVIDKEIHAKYIISKVLQFGLIKDWEILNRLYSLDRITDEAVKIRDLDKKTATFLALINNVPKQKFICYSTKQSTPKHWNF